MKTELPSFPLPPNFSFPLIPPLIPILYFPEYISMGLQLAVSCLQHGSSAIRSDSKMRKARVSAFVLCATV